MFDFTQGDPARSIAMEFLFSNGGNARAFISPEEADKAVKALTSAPVTKTREFTEVQSIDGSILMLRPSEVVALVVKDD